MIHGRRQVEGSENLSLSAGIKIKKSRHEPDNSSDRGHPNPIKWNTSIVLCAKISTFSDISQLLVKKMNISPLLCSVTR